MRSSWSAALVTSAALLLGGAASAQSPSADDAAALRARCEAGAADEMHLSTCLWVVETVLAPVPGASPIPYGADLPGIGVTLVRDDETVTLVDVEWNAKNAFGDRPDDRANRYIALRVLYQATQDGASYNPLSWSLVDLDGFSWDQAFGSRPPALESSNDLPAGRKAQGWVTFEAPKKVRVFEVVESQPNGYLRWIIKEPK